MRYTSTKFQDTLHSRKKWPLVAGRGRAGPRGKRKGPRGRVSPIARSPPAAKNTQTRRTSRKNANRTSVDHRGSGIPYWLWGVKPFRSRPCFYLLFFNCYVWGNTWREGDSGGRIQLTDTLGNAGKNEGNYDTRGWVGWADVDHPMEPLPLFSFMSRERQTQTHWGPPAGQLSSQTFIKPRVELKSGVGHSSQIFNLETRLPQHCGGTSVSAALFVGLVSYLLLSSRHCMSKRCM